MKDDTSTYALQARTWARWNSGPKIVWHGVKNRYPGMMGFTLCGHSIPHTATELDGTVPPEQVCNLCLKTLRAQAKQGD